MKMVTFSVATGRKQAEHSGKEHGKALRHCSRSRRHIISPQGSSQPRGLHLMDSATQGTSDHICGRFGFHRWGGVLLASTG